MCGLVGVAGFLESKDEGLMKRLLLLDFIRGQDSTGLCAIRMDEKHKMAKIASHPLDLFDTQRFKLANSGGASRALIGHNRLATTGEVTAVNAHPYQFGHIWGAHNGTLDKSCTKELEELLEEQFPVDSMAIFAAIEKFGIKETIPLLKGAWALSWYDHEKNTINFIRNSERPLWHSFTKDFKKIIWASEWPMIDSATRLGGWGGELYTNDKGHKFFPMGENIHYAFDLPKLRSGSQERPKPLVQELRGKETKYAGFDSSNPFGMGNRGNNGGHGTNGTTSTTTSEQSSNQNKKNWNRPVKPPKDDTKLTLVHLIGTQGEPFSTLMKRERFEELSQYGCSWCSATIDWGDKGVTIWDRDDIIICSNCSNHDNDANRVYVPNLQAVT